MPCYLKNEDILVFMIFESKSMALPDVILIGNLTWSSRVDSVRGISLGSVGDVPLGSVVWRGKAHIGNSLQEI